MTNIPSIEDLLLHQRNTLSIRLLDLEVEIMKLRAELHSSQDSLNELRDKWKFSQEVPCDIVSR